MCSRHSEPNGADSVDALTFHVYEVKLVPDEGPSWWVRIPRAMGPHDAYEQARRMAWDEGEDASPVAWRVVEAAA